MSIVAKEQSKVLVKNVQKSYTRIPMNAWMRKKQIRSAEEFLNAKSKSNPNDKLWILFYSLITFAVLVTKRTTA